MMEPVNDPLGADRTAVFHCGWSREVNGTTGEFLLRDDGLLFVRTGGSYAAKDSHGYEFSLWRADLTWDKGADLAKCIAWLNAADYTLSEASPVPVDEKDAGPFPGEPPPARRLGR